MAEYTFTPPAFIEENDAESIQERMMNNLPDDIDKTEGGFPWDFTMPTALEKAELVEFELNETLLLMHFMFAEGIYLDYHAEAAGISRKAATNATGTVSIEGTPGTEIPAGFEFAVPASGDDAAIIFTTDTDATIDLNGSVEIPITAEEPGTEGNVGAQTIIIMASPTIDGIESVINEAATTGGTDEESDDDLRERIAQAIQSVSNSFCGCDADYKRWAMEVGGVGSALVIPEWNGPGTVKVIVIDSNGAPASQAIVEAVYNSIVSPNDRSKRKAPIGATVTVVAPSSVDVAISFNLILETDSVAETVIANIRTAIENYLADASDEGEINVNRVGSQIIRTAGVKDYNNLLINNSTQNIPLNRDQYPNISTFNAEVQS